MRTRELVNFCCVVQRRLWRGVRVVHLLAWWCQVRRVSRHDDGRVGQVAGLGGAWTRVKTSARWAVQRIGPAAPPPAGLRSPPPRARATDADPAARAAATVESDATRPEQGRLVDQRRDIADALRAVGDRHRQIREHLPRVMTGPRPPNRCSAVKSCPARPLSLPDPPSAEHPRAPTFDDFPWLQQPQNPLRGRHFLSSTRRHPTPDTSGRSGRLRAP